MLGKSDETDIKVWMLSGDKEETAMNISYACSLLGDSIQQVVVNATTCVDEATLRTKRNTTAREFMDNAKGMAGGTEKAISLFIDGKALEMTLCHKLHHTCCHLPSYVTP